ncbi:uncharacterized protein [Nicotiana sylvestris]|uniref:uncharacterized protein n=1 Tax=Nicotiana sylvestris TaxID=4096 RepID=UPI00388CB774
MADLIELGMVDFDVILGMDWLYSCFTKLDCRTRVVRFEFPNELVIEWKGDDVVPKGRFISYLNSTKMIKNGCIYHLVRFTDKNVEVPTLEYVRVMNEFLEVFADELPGITLDREIDFWIDLIPGHVVSREGINVDPQKITAVKNWPKPTTPIEIRSFLGLDGYYKKFVVGFSTLASPFTKLMQKAVKFQWPDAYERSFQELKSRLITALVLPLPKGIDGFVVYCDAS